VPGTRELVILGTLYLIAYRVREAEIQILHVLHGRQLWPGAF
jgi:toxin ParE1/3/4